MSIIPSGCARLLTIGLFALLPLAACAPDTLNFPPEPEPALDGGDAADGRVEPQPPPPDAPRQERAGAPPSGALSPTAEAADHAIDVGSDRVFDRDRFAAAVAEAAREHDADAAALPGVKVFPSAASRGVPSGFEAGVALEVRGLIARSAQTVRDEVFAIDDVACGPGGEVDCPKRFVRIVAAYNSGFAQAVAPLLRRLPAAATDLRVTVWKVSREGARLRDVVTYHGRIGDRLVGVVFFL